MLLSAFDLPFCGPGTAAVQIKLNLGTDKSSWSHSTGFALLGYIHKPCWLHALKIFRPQFRINVFELHMKFPFI